MEVPFHSEIPLRAAIQLDAGTGGGKRAKEGSLGTRGPASPSSCIPVGNKSSGSSCRWRVLRPSPGRPSSGIAGMKRSNTALPTSAMPKSSIPTSIWATRRGWSSPRSPTGEACPRINHMVPLGPFPKILGTVPLGCQLWRLEGPGIYVRWTCVHIQFSHRVLVPALAV